MKIKTSSKKPLLITLAAIGVLLIGGVAVYAYSQRPQVNDESNISDNSQVKKSEATSDDAPSSELPSKNGDITNEENTNNKSESAHPAPPAAIETPKIERASQSSDAVKIVASFQKASDGKCEARLQNNNATVKKTTSIVLGTAYYSCSFSIPSTEFPSSGSWNLSLSHINGTSVSTAPVQVVTVQK